MPFPGAEKLEGPLTAGFFSISREKKKKTSPARINGLATWQSSASIFDRSTSVVLIRGEFHVVLVNY